MEKSGIIRGIFILMAAAIVLAFVMNSIMISTVTPPPFEPTVVDIEGHEGKMIFHASPLQNSGCADCHTQPIIANCTDCHPSPPTTIPDAIAFPHHDPAPGGPFDDCDSSVCHDASSDIRYVVVLDANHTYCGICHIYTHSQPS